MTNPEPPAAATEAARLLGRREGLALAALATAAVAFLNLLGVEKALLAVTLAALALQGVAVGRVRDRAMTAIVLAAAYLVTVAVVAILYGNRLATLVSLLRDLA